MAAARLAPHLSAPVSYTLVEKTCSQHVYYVAENATHKPISAQPSMLSPTSQTQKSVENPTTTETIKQSSAEKWNTV